MMLRAHTCDYARQQRHERGPPFVCAIRAVGCERGRPPGAFTRRRPYMPLCTRSEVYIRLVCPGIGLAGAATRAPSRRRPSLTTHAVGSKFAFERPVGGSLLDSSRMRRLLVSYRPLACAWPCPTARFSSAFARRLAEGPDPREDNRVGDEVIVFVFVPVL